MELLHENSKGIKMVREDAVKRSKVKVSSGNFNIRTYRFNNLPFYEHPLLSWANLDCCGGWAFDDDYLLTAVQKGKKPVADVITEEYLDISDTDDYKVWHTKARYGNSHQTIIAKNGCLSDLFNLNEILATYELQDVFVNETNLKPYLSTPLIELFQDEFWVHPSTTAEFIVAGLGLGYPIESTASILCGY